MEKINFFTFIIGPSGSGKSTMVKGLGHFLNALNIKHLKINLDPANDIINDNNYDIDIKELITLDDVMEELNLGPNGGLIYCFKTLNENIHWLFNKIKEYDQYIFIIDLPGQLELFMNSDYLKSVINKIKNIDFYNTELTTLMLFDSIYSFDNIKFLSCNIFSLISLINIDLPQINILTKIDLLKKNEKLKKRLEFYLENDQIEDLFENYDSDKFINNIVNLIKNYNLVSFIPCDISDKVSVARIINELFIKLNYFIYSEDKELKNNILSITENQTDIEMYIEIEDEKLLEKELLEFK